MPETPEEAAERAETLRQLIRQYSRSYYLVGDPTAEPEISDAEFDLLVKELKQIEAKYPELAKAKKVGTDENSNLFEDVVHQIPMISLDNAFNLDELKSWLGRLEKSSSSSQENLFDEVLEFKPLACELKFDGLGISVLYENGRLKRVATRGDGEVGENITENAIGINHMPKQLKGDYPERLEVRGEAYLPISEFNRLNEIRKKQDKKIYANPRNTAAGTLRQKDPAAVVMRELSWWCYQLVEVAGAKKSAKGINPTDLKTHSDSLKYLKSLGLPVHPETKIIKSLPKLEEFLGEMLIERDKRDYEVDGVVIKLDNLAEQVELGATSHHPRWATAYKFPPEEKTTILKDIRISIGSKGKVTPFAELEPVFVGGSTVQVATLHNEDQVKEKDIYPGDTVIVRKAGDIIPEVVGAIKSKRPKNAKPWVFPSKCPCPLQVKLVRKESEAAHRCPNPDCEFQQTGRIEHFASRGAMDISGLGEELVKVLVDKGLIGDVADIYFLTDFEELAKLEKRQKTKRIRKDGKPYDKADYGKKYMFQLEKSIKDSKSQPLEKVLFGLSIPNIGATVSKDIATEFGNIDAIMKAKPEDFMRIPGVGEIQAQSIYEYMKNPVKQNIIKKLKQAKVNLKQPKFKSSLPQTLAGKSFVVTGTLEKLGRQEAYDAITDRGGKVQSSVSGNTDYLVVGGDGRNAGAKKKKAVELGISELDEAGFYKVLGV